MPFLFINYRHSDTRATAALLGRRLSSALAPGQVFLDDGIQAGATWPETLREALDRTTVMFALIGPNWFQLSLTDENDWVRTEIETALEQSGTRVCPLLVGVKELSEKQLGDLPTLQPLTDQQTRVLTSASGKLRKGAVDELTQLLLAEGFEPRARINGWLAGASGIAVGTAVAALAYERFAWLYPGEDLGSLGGYFARGPLLFGAAGVLAAGGRDRLRGSLLCLALAVFVAAVVGLPPLAGGALAMIDSPTTLPLHAPLQSLLLVGIAAVTGALLVRDRVDALRGFLGASVGLAVSVLICSNVNLDVMGKAGFEGLVFIGASLGFIAAQKLPRGVR